MFVRVSLLLLSLLLWISEGAFAQSSTLVPFPPTPLVKVAVNPVTNKVYVANEFDDSVTAYDESAGTSVRIPVGPRPQFIAVNPVTNRVYVNNAGDSTLTVIDGSTDTNITPAALQLGSQGPITVNAATNVVYVVRMSSAARDEVTFLNGATNEWYTIATESYQPTAMAVNPVTNTIFVAHYATGDVRVISGAYNAADDFPATTSIPAWSHPFAIAANPVTNKAYVITEDSRGPIGIIDAATLTADFPLPAAGHAQGPKSLAVNPVTNKVYAAFTDEVVVIDGATNAYTYVPIGATGTGPVSIAVNAATNKIYVATSNGSLVVIDGQTNATRTQSIPSGAVSLGINPITNKSYVFGDSLTRGDIDVTTASPVPLATSISHLPGDASGANPSFTLTASSGFTPQAPGIAAVYYQLDSTSGPWTQAAGSGPYTAAFSGLAPGSHTVNAYAVDTQIPPTSTGPQSSVVMGPIASYTFTVSGPPPATPGVSILSSPNPATEGQAVSFTASVTGSSGVPTGSVAFRDGGTDITGCASVALASGSASCTTTALRAGTHSITAAYSGDAAYQPATSAAISETIKALPALSLTSSANPSLAGQSVTFTLNASGGSGTPTGTVSFDDNGSTIAGCTAIALASGSAQCVASLSAGSHAINATYSGDGAYGAATSATLSQTVQAPAGAPVLALSSSSVDFGGQSMNTTSPKRQVVLTNAGSAPLTVTSITASDAQFAAASDCGTVAPGASCTLSISFTPAVADVPLNGTTNVQATISIASNAASSPDAVAVTGSGEKSLVTHYYRSILRRDPDDAGKQFWQGEAARVAQLGADVNEAWFALATNFFASAEYGTFQRDDSGFLTDLYRTFFNREPDADGFAWWLDQMRQGLPRDAVLASFMFSPEFANFTHGIFGNTAVRPEINLAMDFYRGVLARLPDDAGFRFYVGALQDAQCQGADAVRATARSMAQGFFSSAEYGNRQRTSPQYVADLYDATMRRGADLAGAQFWVGQLDSGATSRDAARDSFIASTEFTNRVNDVVAQGCRN